MSKLYKNYLILKGTKPDTLFLFKSGVFYIAIDTDAHKLSELFGFKLINLNETVVKCGFPINKLSYYSSILNEQNLDFEIVDLNSNIAITYTDFSNNSKIKSILDILSNIDMNNITLKESFDLLYKLNMDAKNIVL